MKPVPKPVFAGSENSMHISRWSKSVDSTWYLGVRCRKCHAPILFGIDRSGGEHRFVPPRKLVLTCLEAECRHRADYSTAKVTRFQKSHKSNRQESV